MSSVANNSVASQRLIFGPTAGNGLNYSVLVEGNVTTKVILGFIVFGDVDLNDTVNYVSNITTNTNPGLRLNVSDVPVSDPRLAAFKTTGLSSGVQAKEVSLYISEGSHGTLVHEARVSDKLRAFSLQLTLAVHVLINPCVHGHCRPRDPTNTCSNRSRASSFQPYLCQCDPGYEGEWCQTETDECRHATCSPIHDCVDLIGEYRCDVNVSKMVAIILCPLLAFILLLVIICNWKKKTKKVSPK